MTESVQDTILDIRRVYPEIGTDDAVLRMLNSVHSELIEEFPLVIDTQTVILDGSSREFSLDEDWVAIWSVDYLTSATQRYPVVATSVDELDENNPGWRSSRLGVPSQYYEWATTTGAVIGFDPIPQTATTPSSASGYPRIEMQVSVREPLTLQSNLPATLRTNDVYVKGVALQHAEELVPDEYQLRYALYEQAINALAGYKARRQRRNPSKVSPFLFSGVSRT